MAADFVRRLFQTSHVDPVNVSVFITSFSSAYEAEQIARAWLFLHAVYKPAPYFRCALSRLNRGSSGCSFFFKFVTKMCRYWFLVLQRFDTESLPDSGIRIFPSLCFASYGLIHLKKCLITLWYSFYCLTNFVFSLWGHRGNHSRNGRIVKWWKYTWT